MTDDIPEMPIKWITKEVRKYLTDQQYGELVAGLRLVERRYSISQKLRTAKTDLRNFRRSQQNYPEGSERWRHWGIRIEGKLLHIERVKKELEELR